MSTPARLVETAKQMQALDIITRAVDVLTTYERCQGQVPDELHTQLVKLEIAVGRWKETP